MITKNEPQNFAANHVKFLKAMLDRKQVDYSWVEESYPNDWDNQAYILEQMVSDD